MAPLSLADHGNPSSGSSIKGCAAACKACHWADITVPAIFGLLSHLPQHLLWLSHQDVCVQIINTEGI